MAKRTAFELLDELRGEYGEDQDAWVRYLETSMALGIANAMIIRDSVQAPLTGDQFDDFGHAMAHGLMAGWLATFEARVDGEARIAREPDTEDEP